MADTAAPTPQFIANLFHPSTVKTDGDIAGVPAETPQVSGTPPVTTAVFGGSQPAAAAPPAEPAAPPAAPVQPLPDEEKKPTEEKPAEGEKSPLEILEEILASAGAEKELKEKEAANKKAIEDKEKAEMAAKEAEYRQQAQQKIVGVKEDIAAAQQEQAQVDIEHPAVTEEQTPDQFQIRQLHHQEQPGK